MAITAIAGAAAKAGAAAGKAGGMAAKGAGKAAKGAAKKAGKAAKNKAKRKLLGKVLDFLSHPLTQALIALPFPVGVISYQLMPSISKEIKLLRLVIALFAGGGEAILTLPFIFITLSMMLAGAAVGDAVCEWSWCQWIGGAGGYIASYFALGVGAVGTLAAVWHLFLIGLAWFILIFKFMMRAVLPKRM